MTCMACRYGDHEMPLLRSEACACACHGENTTPRAPEPVPTGTPSNVVPFMGPPSAVEMKPPISWDDIPSAPAVEQLPLDFNSGAAALDDFRESIHKYSKKRDAKTTRAIFRTLDELKALIIQAEAGTEINVYGPHEKDKDTLTWEVEYQRKGAK